MIPGGLKRGDFAQGDEEKEGQDSRDENPPAGGDRTKPSKRRSSPLVSLLMDRIRGFFDSDDPSDPQVSDDELNVDLALQLLEASSGDIDVAVAFFWDNYLANASRLSPVKMKHNDSLAVKRRRSRSPSTGSANAASRKPHPEDSDQAEEEHLDARTARQRLEGRFNQEDEHHADIDNPLNQEPPLPPVAAALAPVNNNHVHDEVDMDEADEIQERNADPDAIAGSVSVSDDEGGGIWRMERRRRRAFQDDRNVDQDMGASRIPRNVSNGAEIPSVNDDNNNDTFANVDGNYDSQLGNDDDETYLSDEDWLTGNSMSTIPQSPSKILWGFSPPDASRTGSDPSSEGAENMNIGITRIPATWLHAGFKMAESGVGLTLNPPSEEDIVFQRLKQQQTVGGSDNRNAALPPFHCKALTAIIAVVNATMLTGASIQGDCVDCSSARTPFVELSEKERKREFSERLGDAIAAILFVAFKVSTARKKLAIEARAKHTSRSNKGNGDFDQMQRQVVSRKLRLCPNCRWQEDAVVGEARLAESGDARVIEIVTSFTNVSDLRSYVKSNMRDFVGKRGCALLLENIICIHGRGTIERMVRKSRQKSGLSVGESVSLITCTCEERQSDIKPAGTGHASHVDTTPPGHQCLSIELVSLLICGEVHSTFLDWSSGRLGFGILSNDSDDVGETLTKPAKPVWILRGDTCHSVIWVDTSKQPAFDMDQQGAVLHLSHWNPWYGIRNLSGFRLNTMRGEWSPAVLVRSATEKEHKSIINSKVLQGIWKRKRSVLRQAQSNLVSSDEQDDEASKAISAHDLDTLQVKAEDQLFYPIDYRRWRYRFGNTDISEVWKSHHILNDRERRIVDKKFGSRISQILWSRWPNSTVDKFTPEDEPLPVV